jgi:hypothetical protein
MATHSSFAHEKPNTLSTFPDVPWATEVAKDFATSEVKRLNLVEITATDQSSTPSDLTKTTHSEISRGDSRTTGSTGNGTTPTPKASTFETTCCEPVYGTMSNIKTMEADQWANLEFDWVAFVPGQGEFRRYVGDYILTENDIREHTEFPDAIVENSGAFCSITRFTKSTTSA